MANRTTRTAKKEASFLAALSSGDSVTKACEVANIARRTVYEWRGRDEKFAQAWAVAEAAGTDRLEDEARRRAHEGYDEPVWYQGKQVGVVRKHSDTLMIFLLKARRPEKYRERTEVQHSGNVTVNVVRFSDAAE